MSELSAYLPLIPFMALSVILWAAIAFVVGFAARYGWLCAEIVWHRRQLQRAPRYDRNVRYLNRTDA